MCYSIRDHQQTADCKGVLVKFWCRHEIESLNTTTTAAASSPIDEVIHGIRANFELKKMEFRFFELIYWWQTSFTANLSSFIIITWIMALIMTWATCSHNWTLKLRFILAKQSRDSINVTKLMINLVIKHFEVAILAPFSQLMNRCKVRFKFIFHVYQTVKNHKLATLDIFISRRKL